MENTINTSEISRPRISPEKVLRRKIHNRYEWAGIALLIQNIIGTCINILFMGLVVFIQAQRSGDLIAGLKQAVQGSSSGPDYTIPIAGVAFIIANIIAAVISLKVSKAGKIRDNLVKPVNIGVIGIIMACFAILGISNLDEIIMSKLTSLFGSSNAMLNNSFNAIFEYDNKLLTVFSLFYVCIAGPILEEVLCRGALLKLSSHIDIKFGIVFSSLLFGIMHGNLSQLFNATLLGLLLAYVTVKTRSLIPAMFMHIVNNSYSMILYGITRNMTEEQGTSFAKVNNLVFMIIGLVCFVIIILRLRKVDSGKNPLMINEVAPESDISNIKASKAGLTVKEVLTSWAFWFNIGIFALNMMTVSMMAGR